MVEDRPTSFCSFSTPFPITGEPRRSQQMESVNYNERIKTEGGKNQYKHENATGKQGKSIFQF
jgi:hypothetical protein